MDANPTERVQRTNALVRALRELAEAVDERATLKIRRAKAQLRFKAGKGAWWRVFESIVEYSIARLGTLMYLLVALVGLTYSVGYYREFGINILDYFDTPDFFLSGFNHLGALLGGALVSIALGTLLVSVFYVHNVRSAYYEVGDRHRFRSWRVPVAVAMVLMLTTPLTLPFLIGVGAGSAKLNTPQPVRVTIRGGSASKTALPKANRTILLGTTSGYHFFFQCNNAPVDETRQLTECEGGKPFIVPTDNLAAVSYDYSDEPHAESSDVADAINNLGGAISELEINPTVAVDTANVTLDTKDVAEAIATLRTAVSELNLPDGPMREGSGSTTRIAAELTDLRTTIAGLVRDEPSGCVSGLKMIATVGPFKVGEHVPVDPTTAKNAFEDLLGRPPERIVLIGRVDTTQFSSEGLERYGSDEGLGQRRATSVWNRFVALSNEEGGTLIDDVLERAVLMGGGPLYVGNASETDREKDRIVEIWGCGVQES